MRRITFFLILCALVSGCKIEIAVPEGGSVVSSSGAYNCSANRTCTISVVDIYFDETFSTRPASDYQFTNWKKRNRSFCGGKSTPCRLFTAGFLGNETLMGFLESNEVFYLQPVFEKIGTVNSSAATLYVSGQSGRDIVSVNPANAAVKGSYDSDSGRGVGMTDLEFVNGQLYGIENYGSSLYKVNFDAKSRTTVGSTGVLCDPTCSLFALNGKLYLLDHLRKVYEINLNTGFASPTAIAIPGYLVTPDGSGTLSVMDVGRRLGGYDLHTFDLDTGSILRTVSISNPGDYDLSDMAYTRDGLIAVSRVGGTLVKIDSAAGSATGYAAIDSDLNFYNGMTSN